MKTVFVGMSGGVDSSVTAALLKERGFNVVGVHLRCWNVDGCAEQDAEDARRAAETLGIPFYVFDFEKEYKELVVQYMVDGYKKGITPNPDVMCNQEIKFGLFYQRALELGADYVATGHYVRRVTRNMYHVSQERIKRNLTLHVTCYTLHTARDASKDQSYFLWTLTQKQLAHCLFPIGDFIKRTEVRRLAKKYKLPNADKKDSQGICFLGQVTLDEFLADFIPARRGAVITTGGKVIGEHKGAQFYTIGQRRGIGIGGSASPLYVAAKDVRKNILTVAKENDPALYKKEITLSNVNLIDPRLSALQSALIRVWCRVRYRQPLFRATLTVNHPRSSASRSAFIGVLRFAQPQKFVAPGQSAVFYRAIRSIGSRSKSKDFEILGGGIITKVI